MSNISYNKQEEAFELPHMKYARSARPAELPEQSYDDTEGYNDPEQGGYADSADGYSDGYAAYDDGYYADEEGQHEGAQARCMALAGAFAADDGAKEHG